MHDKYFSRLLLMLKKLSEEGSVSVEDLATEYNCDKRTIYRDIQRLHFFPIELENGMVTLANGFNIENCRLQDNELLIAELAFSTINGIDNSIDKQIQSIRAKLSHPLFFTPYSIKTQAYEEIDIDSKLLNDIEKAIKGKNISDVTSNSITSTIEPYRVVSFDGFWYLFAKDMEDNKIKTYFISHISDFQASRNIYDTTLININEALENVHTAWFEHGNSFEVKIKVKPLIAHYFKQKNYLPSQDIIKENPDGSLIVTFDVSSDEDIDNMIKSWLPHIEVIQPVRFRKKMILELENYVKELRNVQYDIS